MSAINTFAQMICGTLGAALFIMVFAVNLATAARDAFTGVGDVID